MPSLRLPRDSQFSQGRDYSWVLPQSLQWRKKRMISQQQQPPRPQRASPNASPCAPHHVPAFSSSCSCPPSFFSENAILENRRYGADDVACPTVSFLTRKNGLVQFLESKWLRGRLVGLIFIKSANSKTSHNMLGK